MKTTYKLPIIVFALCFFMGCQTNRQHTSLIAEYNQSRIIEPLKIGSQYATWLTNILVSTNLSVRILGNASPTGSVEITYSDNGSTIILLEPGSGFVGPKIRISNDNKYIFIAAMSRWDGVWYKRGKVYIFPFEILNKKRLDIIFLRQLYIM